MKRLILACSAIMAVVALATPRSATRAAATDWTIQSLDCSTTLGHIRVLKSGIINSSIGNLGVQITQVGGTPFLVDVSTLLGSLSAATTVQPNPGTVLDLQVGIGAANSVTDPLTNGNTIAVTGSALLQPGATVQLFDAATGLLVGGAAKCPGVGLSRTLTVSTAGFDLIAPGVPNSVCGPDLTAGTAPTPLNPGPCFTIQNALFYARDGDTIVVETGIYEICSTITVDKLVNITAGASSTPGNALVILHSFAGQTVFHVTAVGGSGAPTSSSGASAPASGSTQVGPVGQSTHAAINGLAIGGAFLPAAAAIFLANDGYTDVTNNVLGGEPLHNPAFTGVPCVPNSNPLPSGFPASAPPGFTLVPPTPMAKSEIFGNATNVILSNSDHPNISNNSILGSAIFQFSPVLAVGEVLTGFGIVTSECLGLQADASDSINMTNNLIDRNTNAGVWLCSDGGGLHNIKTNVVRNNGRGIVLRAIEDSTLDSNTVSNNFQDGIIVYDASTNNTISNNTIESHRTPGAAGIRIGDFGAGLYPLLTPLTGNKLLRNWIGLDIAGARSTIGTNNIITAEDIRTAVFIQVGSQGAPTITQPQGTVLHQNQIFFNGGCASFQGCA
ncbi:MAG TPA: right-handed parallel beta-helix repeat-containing protein, partial [Dehalococcoidia bacterium]